MTEAQRRLMHARENVEAKYLNPITELLDAAKAAVRDAERRATRAEVTLEALRPHWAMGHTSDSVAAQASTTALSELWLLLGVTDQTAAMARLRELVG